MSFKLKLVAYFLLVSLLPLGAAAWGLHASAWKTETRGVDVRLEAGLRAVLATYKDELSTAGRRATALAADPGFQRALARRDRRTLERFLGAAPHVRLESKDLTLGPAKTIGPSPQVAVAGPNGVVLGTLVGGVPLSRRVLHGLSDHSGLDSDDTLVVLENGRIAAGPRSLVGKRLASPLEARTLKVGGDRYRTLAARPDRGERNTALALLTPQAEIDNGVADADKRLLGAVHPLVKIV